MKYTLYDDFCFKGYWWLPEEPDDELYGELQFKGTESIELELVGSFKESGSVIPSKPIHPDFILGHSTEGNKITLYKSVMTKGAGHFPGMPTCAFSPAYLFVNEHFVSESELLFSSVIFNTLYMEEWMVIMNPFNVGYTQTKEGRLSEYHAKYVPLEPFTGRISAIDSSFETVYDFSTSSDPFRMLNWRMAAFLKIISDEAQPFDWWIRVVNEMCNLLTLFVGEPVREKQIILKLTEADTDETEKSSESPVRLYFRQPEKPLKESVHPHDMLITLRDIKPMLSDVWQRWFENAEVLRALYDLFFAALYDRNMLLDFELLCYVHGLESYYGAAYGGRYLNDDSFESAYQALVAAIPDSMPQDFRDSITQRLKFTNEFSQRKRLFHIIQSLGHGLESLLGSNPREFIESVVATRNYLIHHDPVDKELALRGRDLYEANQRLKMLIIAVLMKEMGIDEETTFKVIKENRRYSGFFTQT